MAGGLAQAYATMGFCTCMKTVEMTKHKAAATFMDIYRKEGIKGINKGVNAVAVRQVTNWGSRFGLSRLAYVISISLWNKICANSSNPARTAFAA